MVGFHRSRRPGEGGELAGVRVFSPGDRLRRIDWRVSLRTRQLHVAATLSDRDAEIVVLLDVLHESGRSGGVFGRRSVLDLTVRAAAGIAEHYLHRGDRVSLVEYGGFSRRLRASSGHRHFMASLEWLLDVRTRSGMESPPVLFGAHMMSPNALVIVLTPLIDPRSAAMLARLARSGRTVVAVDTLPAELWRRAVRPGLGRLAAAAPLTSGRGDGGPAGARQPDRAAARARRSGGHLDRRRQPGRGAAAGVPDGVGARRRCADERAGAGSLAPSSTTASGCCAGPPRSRRAAGRAGSRGSGVPA